MNRISKIGVVAGIFLQIATVVCFFSWVRPLNAMSLVCLCFLLFAELEFFGSIVFLSQYAYSIPTYVRVGLSVTSGIYSCLAIVVAISFIPFDESYLRLLLMSEILLLICMLLLNTGIVTVYKLKK